MALTVKDAQASFSSTVLAAGLAQAQGLVHAINVEKGWHDEERTFGDDIALLHSEVSEMLEEFRAHGTGRLYEEPMVTADGVTTKHLYKAGEQDYPEGYKPIGVPSEAADVFVRLLDTCERHGINLAAEFTAKIAYNASRPYRHGNKAL